MYLKIKKINNKVINDAQDFFWVSFCSNLKKEKLWTYNESLIARYLINKNTQVVKESCFSSISHKKDLVFIWINKTKIWVDIEILKERDISLLEENKVDNWESFYRLWTAKECIIKFENLLLDDMKQILLIKSEKIDKKVSWIKFNLKFIFKFDNKNFNVLSWNKEKIYYSICF